MLRTSQNSTKHGDMTLIHSRGFDELNKDSYLYFSATINEEKGG